MSGVDFQPDNIGRPPAALRPGPDRDSVHFRERELGVRRALSDETAALEKSFSKLSLTRRSVPNEKIVKTGKPFNPSATGLRLSRADAGASWTLPDFFAESTLRPCGAPSSDPRMIATWCGPHDGHGGSSSAARLHPLRINHVRATRQSRAASWDVAAVLLNLDPSYSPRRHRPAHRDDRARRGRRGTTPSSRPRHDPRSRPCVVAMINRIAR